MFLLYEATVLMSKVLHVYNLFIFNWQTSKTQGRDKGDNIDLFQYRQRKNMPCNIKETVLTLQNTTLPCLVWEMEG